MLYFAIFYLFRRSFLKKSLKVSLFVAKTDVYDWYVIVYKNETFLFILQRSIIEGKRLRVYTLHNSKKKQ